MNIKKENVFVVILIIGIIIISGLFLTQQTKNNSTNRALSDYVKKETTKMVEKELEEDNSLKEGFMDGCLENDNTQDDYCNCSYDFLEKKLGNDGLMKMGLEIISDDGLSDKSLNIIIEGGLECISEYK